MGPMLTFHLAGGQGGMAHMLDHFGPALLEPWTRLDAPRAHPASCATASSPASDEAAGGRTRRRARAAARRLPGRPAAAAREAPPWLSQAAERRSRAYPADGRPEWIDYNGHLNDASYAIVLSAANEVLLEHLGLSADYRASHRRCDVHRRDATSATSPRLGRGDRSTAASLLVDADHKRLRAAQRLPRRRHARRDR